MNNKMNNRAKEMERKNIYHEGWNLSKKYSSILIDHENNNEYFVLAANIYHQYISELRLKNIPHVGKNYVQVWETMLNTLEKNPKIPVCRGSIKLLHQTNCQRAK